MPSSGTPLSLDTFRAHARILATLAAAAEHAIDTAAHYAEALYREVGDGRASGMFERFDHEVEAFVATLARDLGLEINGYRGDFDPGRVARDARDLLDLIEVAASRAALQQCDAAAAA